MKKAGIFAAVIAVVLIFLHLYSYKLLGYTPETVYTVPDTSLASALLAEDDGKDKEMDAEISSGLELKKLEASSPYYRRGKTLYMGEEREKVEKAYPMYKEDGAGVYSLSDSMRLISADFGTLLSYEWLYLSGGMSFNQDGSQADPDEFILVGLGDGLYLNAQEALITGRAGNQVACLKENSIVGFSAEKISWYEYGEGRLVYKDCTQLFDARITIGSVSMPYTEFLKRLDILKDEADGKKDRPKETEKEPESSPLEPVVSEADTDTAAEDREETTEEGGQSKEPESETQLLPAKPETTGETAVTEPDTRQRVPGETNPFFPVGNKSDPGDREKKDKNSGGSTNKKESGDAGPSAGGTEATGPTYDDPWGQPGEGDGGEGEGEGEGGAETFRMPKVTAGQFTMGVYSASTTITIEDEDSRIIKGARLIIYRDGRIYMRKLIPASGPVVMDPLPPDTEFEIEGYFEYFGRDDSKEMSYYLKRQIMPERTKKMDQLNQLLFTFETDQEVRYPDRLSVTGMELSEEQKQPPATPGDATPGDATPGNGSDGGQKPPVSYAAIPYIQRLDMELEKKAIIQGGTLVQSVDSTTINQLKNGNTKDWMTKTVLDSNSDYNYEFRFYDRFGNQFKTAPSELTGKGQTSKKPPKAQIQFEKNAPISQQPITITMSNKDQAEFYKQNSTGGYDGVKSARFYMVEAGDLLNPIEIDVSGNGDMVRYVDVSSTDGRQTRITVHGLPAGHVYYGIVTGSYDLNDGSFYTDQEIGRAAFTTSDLTTLGSVNFLVKPQSISATSVNIQAYLRTSINKLLIPFIKRTEITVANQDTGEVYRTISLNKEDLNQDLMTDREYVIEDTTGTAGEGQFGEKTVISLVVADGTKTAWDALLTNGTVKISFPDKSMKSSTPYLVSIRTYAKQDVAGAREEDVTGKYYTGSFKTLKKTPKITYENMLVTNNFARIYGLKISDPDGVIKNGAVTAILTMTENGKTVALEASTVDKINAMESYNFNSLSNRVKYELKLYAIEYNEGFSSSSSTTNVLLQSDPLIQFETGTTINGSLDINGLLDVYGGAVKGRNLFDPNDAKLNCLVDGVTGSLKMITTASPYVVSDFIPVKDSSIYLFTGTTWNGTVYYYDKDKNYMKNYGNAATASYWRIDEPLDGAAYVRLSMYQCDLSTARYCELDESLFSSEASSNLYDQNSAADGYFVDSSGNNTAKKDYFTSDYIKVTGGKCYVKTGIHPAEATAYQKIMAFYDQDKKFLTLKNLTLGDGTYRMPETAAYIKVSAWIGSKADFYFGKVPTDLWGDNLIGPDTEFKEGYYLSAVGTEIENASYKYSASYIPVEAGAVYYRGQATSDTMFYDKNKTLIGRLATDAYNCLIPPENAAYIRISVSINNNPVIYKVMPSPGNNQMTAKLSVNISDKESYLQNHPYYWIQLEKEKGDGTYEQIEEKRYDVTVIDGKVQPVSAYQEFDVDRSSNYRATMKVDLFDQKGVILDQTEFRTAEPLAKSYIIRTEAGLAAIRSDPFGTYTAVADIVSDNTNFNFTAIVFNGTLDFQGHSLTRTGTPALFSAISETGVVKNMVLHASVSKNQTFYDSNSYLANTNQGLITDIVADFDVNMNGGVANISRTGGLCYLNDVTGIIENFTVTLLDDYKGGAHGGLAASINKGIVRNGYAYDNGGGYKFDTTDGNTSGVFYKGALVGTNEVQGLVESVYSLVDVNTAAAGATPGIGTVVGLNQGWIRNVFTTADALCMGVPQAVNGPAVGIAGLYSQYSRISNVRYVRLKDHVVECYKNTVNLEADRASLLDPGWYEQAVNQTGAFDTSTVVSGYYPRLRMSEAVAGSQPIIPVPANVKPQTPTLVSASVKEQREKEGKVELIFTNPQQLPVREVTISAKDGKGNYIKAMDCHVEDQRETEDGAYIVNITVDNPTAFYSLYYVNGFTVQNGASSSEVIPVLDQILPVYLEFYEDITDLAGWSRMVAAPAANYRIRADIDFRSVTDAQMSGYVIYDLTGKIDGGYEDETGYHISTLKNLRLPSVGYMFGNLYGSIKNLRVDGMEGAGPSGSLVNTMRSGMIDNLQIKNASLTGSARIAGIVGTASYGDIVNCGVTDSYFESVRSREESVVGGIAAQVDYARIRNSFVSNITMNLESALFVQGAGGICGKVNWGQINNCYAQGTLTSNYSYSGGIVGYDAGSFGINNNISIMNLVTNGSGYTGGIAGSLGGGTGARKNLAVGDLYSASQNPNFFHRISGFRNSGITQVDNLAYSGQLFKGYIDPVDHDDALGLVSSDELKQKEIYVDRLGLTASNFEFAYSEQGKTMGIAEGYLPLLKNRKTGELLENQTPYSVSQTGVFLRIEAMNINPSPQKDFEKIFGAGAQQDFGDGRLYQLRYYVEAKQPYAILDAEVEGMTMNATHHYGGITKETFEESSYVTEEGNSRTAQRYPFLSCVYAFDRYRLIVKATPPGNLTSDGKVIDEKQVVTLSSSFDLKEEDKATFKISNAREWNDVMTQYGGIFGNFELTGDIDASELPPGETLVTGVKVNRLYSTKEGGVTIKNVNMKSDSFGTSFITEASGNIRYVNFEDIVIDNSSIVSANRYVGVIGQLWGTMDHVNFSRITVAGNGDYVGCIGYSGGFVSDVELTDIIVKGIGNSHGGLAGFLYQGEQIKASGTKKGDDFTYRISGTDGVGGIVGVCGKSVSNVWADSVRIAATGGPAGAITGNGSINPSFQTEPEQYSSVSNSVITAAANAGGAAGIGGALYVNVDSCSIAATNDNIGGVVGNSIVVSNFNVRNTVVSGRTNVGGVVGYNGSRIMGNGSVENCVISGDSQVGGIGGTGAASGCKVSGCVITARASYAGGVAGKIYPTVTRTSVYNCRITANSYVGGLGGSDYVQSGIVTYSTVAESEIVSGRMTAEGDWASYAGGLVGKITLGTQTDHNSIDTKTTVNADGNYVGGMVGYTAGGQFGYNTIGTQVNQAPGMGDYSRYVGGLAGGISTYGVPQISANLKKTTFYNNYFAGNVKGADYVGGLFGAVEPSSEAEAPRRLQPDLFYGMVMTGNVETVNSQSKPAASYWANMMDPSEDPGTIGYLRVYDGSTVNGTPAAAQNLEYLGKAADPAGTCLVTSGQLTDRATYFNLYADGGLDWVLPKVWSDQGLLPLYGTKLKVTPEIGVNSRLKLYSGDISDGTYDAVVESGYVESGLKLEYDGINNTRKGHDPNARTWENLAGNEAYDMVPDRLNFDLASMGSGYSGHDGWSDQSYVITTDNTGLSTQERGWTSTGTKGYYSDMTISATFKSNTAGPAALAGFGSWAASYDAASLVIEGSKIGVMCSAYPKDDDQYVKDVVHNATVVFTASDVTGRLYVDGVLKKTFKLLGPWENLMINSQFNAMITANGRTLRGELFNTKFYTRALEPQEVMQNYKVDMQRFDAGTSGTVVKTVPVTFKNGTAVLDTAVLGLTDQETANVKIWILPSGQGTATSSNTQANVLVNGGIYGFRYGQPYLDYTEVRSADGSAVTSGTGMYVCNTTPTAVLPPADKIIWYRSAYPGYSGKVVQGAEDMTETLAGRGYYYAQVTKGAVTYLTPLIQVETDAYLPYLRDNVLAAGYPILDGLEGYMAEDRAEEVILPDTYSVDGSHQKTDVPDLMKKLYTPKSTADQWIEGGIAIPGSSVIMLDESVPQVRTLGLDAAELPQVTVYPSGAATVNLEFDETYSPEYTFMVYAGNEAVGSHTMDNRVYTMTYDYESPLKVVVTGKDGAVAMKEYGPYDLKRTVMVWEDRYYYLNEGVINGNGETPEGECINLYGGEALMGDGTVISLHSAGTPQGSGTGAAYSEKPVLLPEALPIYETEYDGCTVTTYERFSEVKIDGQVTVRELKLFANKGRLFGLDTSESVPGCVMADEYLDQVCMGTLEESGRWQNLGDPIKVPSGLALTGIAHTSQNMGSEEPWLLIRYQNGIAKGFNYVTGETLEVANPESSRSLLHYAGGYLSSRWESWFADKKEAFADIKELEKDLTIYPLDDSMLIDGDRAGVVEKGSDETEFAKDGSGSSSNGNSVASGSADEGGYDAAEAEDAGTVGIGGMDTPAGREAGSAEGNGDLDINGLPQPDTMVKPDNAGNENQPNNHSSSVTTGDKSREGGQNDENLTLQNASAIPPNTKDGSDSHITEPSKAGSSKDTPLQTDSRQTGTPEKTNYVYIYNPSKGSYSLYKAEDLLLKEEESLISEEEKIEQLKARGIVVNLNQVEQVRQKTVSKENTRGIAVFTSAAVLALVLAGYVVRKKRSL